MLLVKFSFTQEVDVEEGKEDVLMSKQWGSMFTDLETKITPDEEENSNSTGNPHTLGRKTTIEQLKVDASKEDIILSELNTFWGELVRKCSTIAIPKLDFLTGTYSTGLQVGVGCLSLI